MAFKKGHNTWNKGMKGYMAGRKVSQETRDKLSKALKGRILSQKAIENARKSNLGREPWNKGLVNCFSDETLVKMSKAKKGVKLSEEHKNNIKKNNVRYWLGKKQPKSAVEKMRKAQVGNTYRLGHKHTAESKEKMRLASLGNTYNKGRKMSLESRLKISLSKTNPSEQARKNMRLAAIKRIANNKGQLKPQYNYQACKFFNVLNESLNLNGFHAENNNEYHIKGLGYWLDYYEPDLNIAIEWDEARHYDINGELTAKDQHRQAEIEKHLGCIFMRIREDENLNAQLNLVMTHAEIIRDRIT